ncbi:reverse transcriptase domain-containing protein [Tanacetum coccineum]
MNKLIIELPTLTTLGLKKTLYVYLVASKDAILNKPKVSGKLAKYAVELGAYNITYVPRNAIKGQVLADFLNEVLVGTKHLEICSPADEESWEEWTLYTEEASSLKGVGTGFILIDTTGTEYTNVIQMNFPSTNNEAEYEALLDGLQIAEKINVRVLKVMVDSKLKADVLSKLASVAFNHLTKEVLIEVLNTKSMDVQEVNMIVEEEEDNWMIPIIKCLEEGVWPMEENEERTHRMKISQYVIEEGVLFRLPRVIVTDNRTQLVNDPFKSWKRVGWVDELPNILWAHRTILKTSNGETPFNLTYGSEVVISAEIGIPTYMTIQFNEAQNKEEMRLNLNLIQERIETAAIREAKYKKKVE